MSEVEQLEVQDRFRGPPNSGNGGYIGGLTSALYDDAAQAVEVTLRAPIPLDQPLIVQRGEPGIRLFDQDQLIVESQPVSLDLAIPQLPDAAEIAQARPSSASFLDRANPLVANGKGFHPICFCCGAMHENGLQVHPAPVLGGTQVAALWHAKSQWGVDGLLPPAFVWAALDCPGQFAFLADNITTGLLGRITGAAQPVPAGEDYIITGWRIGVEGKKYFAGTALHSLSGKLLAKSRQVWIGRR